MLPSDRRLVEASEEGTADGRAQPDQVGGSGDRTTREDLAEVELEVLPACQRYGLGVIVRVLRVPFLDTEALVAIAEVARR